MLGNSGNNLLDAGVQIEQLDLQGKINSWKLGDETQRLINYLLNLSHPNYQIPPHLKELGFSKGVIIGICDTMSLILIVSNLVRSHGPLIFNEAAIDTAIMGQSSYDSHNSEGY